MDRRALFASGAAAALLAATGVSAKVSPHRAGRMRAALSGADRLDRFDTTQNHGLFMQVAMVGAVFDTLTEVAADGTLRAELATAWQGTTDARTWVFDLRKHVTFHNGAAFQAADVAASFALHEQTVLSDVVRVTTLGPHRIEVELAAGDPHFPYRLTDPRLVIYPAGHITEAMYHGIGTGLYRVHRFQAGRQFIGHRVDTHYKDGQAGWFDEVELVALSADAVRAEALREHYVDVADLTHAADLGDVSNITMLPEEDFMTTAVDHCIVVPRQVGSRWPLDNLRAAERWWMA
ncbi:MAG: ABC transporter substrate-binding protein [Roseobacter sp.]|jgi:MarR-like DNA-binding transcriptional regulator SgrR of sgrS sRNA|nr:ABC transporter substrate-binding protein [Roseobacter sp.]